MLTVAFAGTFAASLEPRVRSYLAEACAIDVADEVAIVGRLADVDVLVTLAFTREMADAAKRLRLVQVPGAGLDRIDRAALPAGNVLMTPHVSGWTEGMLEARARAHRRQRPAGRPGRTTGQSRREVVVV